MLLLIASSPCDLYIFDNVLVLYNLHSVELGSKDQLTADNPGNPTYSDSCVCKKTYTL